MFDVVANNTDRKSGHCLIDRDDHIWGIDHGLCFAADFKLRTVIWEFGGEPIPDALLERRPPASSTAVPLGVATLLDDDEVEAISERASWLVEHPVLPHRRQRAPLPLAARVSDGPDVGWRQDDDVLEALVARADLDGLVRLVDDRCATHDWAGLLLRPRPLPCRRGTGRQLWPAATLAEYRLALLAPRSGPPRWSTRRAAASRSAR